jgi:hypothetical protein
MSRSGRIGRLMAGLSGRARNELEAVRLKEEIAGLETSIAESKKKTVMLEGFLVQKQESFKTVLAQLESDEPGVIPDTSSDECEAP